LDVRFAQQWQSAVQRWVRRRSDQTTRRHWPEDYESSSRRTAVACRALQIRKSSLTDVWGCCWGLHPPLQQCNSANVYVHARSLRSAHSPIWLPVVGECGGDSQRFRILKGLQACLSNAADDVARLTEAHNSEKQPAFCCSLTSRSNLPSTFIPNPHPQKFLVHNSSYEHSLP
jgi:hypothetical protein